MAGETAIEWADATWNPIVGCEIVSPGCKHCYAMGQAARIERMAAGAGRPTHYSGTTVLTKTGPVFTGKVAEAGADTLSAPLRWRRPRRIFVNSMGDLFAPGVTNAMRDPVWAVMASATWHTFIVLTKRASAMREYVEDLLEGNGLDAWSRTLVDHPVGRRPLCELIDAWALSSPRPNIWLGVTAEDQERANERIPVLLATPAAVRIVSVEPMIGSVLLRRLRQHNDYGKAVALDGLTGRKLIGKPQLEPEHFEQPFHERGVDWVIVGGESGRGPGVRPMHPAWARQVRDDCAAAGVPFFFKQWGEWGPVDTFACDRSAHAAYAGELLGLEGHRGGPVFLAVPPQLAPEGDVLRRVGKRAAGGLLDGVSHHAWPEARA